MRKGLFPPSISSTSSPFIFFFLEGEFKECGAVSRGYGWKAFGNVGRNWAEGAAPDRNSPGSFWSHVRNHQGSSYHTKERSDVAIFSHGAPQPSFNECCLLIKETATHWRPWSNFNPYCVRENCFCCRVYAGSFCEDLTFSRGIQEKTLAIKKNLYVYCVYSRLQKQGGSNIIWYRYTHKYKDK